MAHRRVALVLAAVLLAGLTVVAVPGAAPAPAQTADGGVDAQAMTSGGEYIAITPTRILDTRDGTGGLSGPRGVGQTDDVAATGIGSVPGAASVAAVVINVTVTDTTGPSFLTVWPSGEGRPLASNINFVGGQTVANLVTVKTGGNGNVSVYNHGSPTDVVFDIVGYYSTPSGNPGARFHGLTRPTRALDTRSSSALTPGQTLSLGVTNVGGVPGGASGVALNITVTQSLTSGFLTVFPGNVGLPLASSVNYGPGQTVPNLVIVGVPPSGVVNIYTSGGPVHVIADVVGWYDADRSTESGRFVPVTPSRVLDTRDANQPIGSGEVRNLEVTGNAGVPAIGAGTVVMNTTVTESTTSSYLTVYPQGIATPTTSNLNFVGDQTVANLVIAKLSQGGAVSLFNRDGSTQVVGDVAGYFTEVTFGFDSCDAPPVSTMAAWKASSPYTAAGIYIGGGLRACAQAQLSANWVSTVVGQGWRLIPIYVGLQAPCTTYRAVINPGIAQSQGVVAADDAADKAIALGISGPAPIYFDMEFYDRNAPGCSTAVQQFMAGWVTRLHQRGFTAGLYSSLAAGIVDQYAAFQVGMPIVDALWIAAWATPPNANLYGFPGLPDQYWAVHQRIHQYIGGHDETWGGVTLNVDSNVIDGPLAP
jgi:hypothetical protein